MKKITSLFIAVCVALPLFSQPRGKINIPDLQGYVTLKCDFHIHTVYSDGVVWPTVRIDEAYREGLDVIAITEHIEFNPRKELAGSDHNSSYEIAKAYPKNKDIILIKGSEISRNMPPGHHNALFLSNSNELDTPDWMDAFRAAKAQNAFIFWNHPGWLWQQPDTTLWWNEHTQLLEQGMMHGIEVCNTTEYYPEAHRWCLEKKLTMLGNSDVHATMEMNLAYIYPAKHRPMTLVFAKERTPESIREALDDRRTAVYWNDYVIGEEKYLKELFENAVEWKVEKTGRILLINGVKAASGMGEEIRVTVRNKSDLTFHLKKTQHDSRVVYFRHPAVGPITLAPNSEITFTVRLLEGIKSGDVNFCVENFLTQPAMGMNYTLKIE